MSQQSFAGRTSRQVGALIDNARAARAVGQRVLQRQVAKRRISRALRARGADSLVEAPFECAVYFPDDPVNLYQIRQWYAPLLELAKSHPLVVLSRMPETTLQLLEECPLPVRHTPRVVDVETFMGWHRIALVLYVNQNVRNFQMLRFARPAHVFVSHGESDKSYMASNQLKAYDRVFIAGDAAAERLEGAINEFDVSGRTVQIGRPQTDVTYSGPLLPSDGRVTVLYAPTWEGDRASMAYGSIATHGEAMVAALLADRRFRIVYRPHPRSGAFDATYRHASKRIVRLIRDANQADPTAAHLVDVDTAFGWHLAQLDVCVTDVSAVALDWLATGKPLVLTRPASPLVEVVQTRLTESVPLLPAAEAADVVGVIDAVFAEPGTARADAVRHYFGDTSPGAATARFVAACDDLIRARVSST